MQVTSKYRRRHGLKSETSTRFFYPLNNMVSNWQFEENQEEEANLADALSRVAQKNEVTVNDLHHLFPAILRMLKDKSQWSK